VRVGTLDEIPEWARPDAHIFTESKMPWLELPKGVCVAATYPKNAEHLPESSRQRRDALIEKAKAGDGR
jgi:hypothetical protein